MNCGYCETNGANAKIGAEICVSSHIYRCLLIGRLDRRIANQNDWQGSKLFPAPDLLTVASSRSGILLDPLTAVMLEIPNISNQKCVAGHSRFTMGTADLANGPAPSKIMKAW